MTMDKVNIFIHVLFTGTDKFWDIVSQSLYTQLLEYYNKAIINKNINIFASHEWIKFCDNLLVDQEILGKCITLLGDTGLEFKPLHVKWFYPRKHN